MAITSYTYGIEPNQDHFKGLPLGDPERHQAGVGAKRTGVASEEIYNLRERPEVWLRVAAFIRKTLGRTIEIHEQSGYLDPHVRIGNSSYSLFREEGHGLRELVTLLAATYGEDWRILVVDEPELHLHPSMVRLWLAELEKECRNSGRRAVVVTHEPSMIQPKSVDDLNGIWYFSTGKPACRLGSCILPAQTKRVTASLQRYPQLVSTLVFSPRPVLVEGIDDVTALTVALMRTQSPEIVAQTDLAECGSNGGVALWFEIGNSIGFDVRAIADLDSFFAPEVQRTMDSSSYVRSRYGSDLAAEPATTSTALRPLIEQMNKESILPNPKNRAQWLAHLKDEGGHSARKSKLIEIWRGAGLWIHPQGCLEDVLGITEKGAERARLAAQMAGPIDDVADWCAFKLDHMGEVELLLNVAVEKIAHQLMEAIRIDPEAEFDAPAGPNAIIDERLVQVISLGAGEYELRVKAPTAFAGWWLRFSRQTPSSDLVLKSPKID